MKLTRREQSARSSLLLSVLLLPPGMVITDPVAGIALFLIAIIFTIAALLLARVNYWKYAVTLLLVATVLLLLRFPDARDNYLRDIEKAKASATLEP